MLHLNERMDLITEYMTSYEEIKWQIKTAYLMLLKCLSYLLLKYVMFGLDRSLAI